MFDLLKKKISGFIEGFLGKEEKKPEQQSEKPLEVPRESKETREVLEKIPKEEKRQEKPKEKIVETKAEIREQKPEEKKETKKEEPKSTEKTEQKPVEKKEQKKEPVKESKQEQRTEHKLEAKKELEQRIEHKLEPKIEHKIEKKPIEEKPQVRVEHQRPEVKSKVESEIKEKKPELPKFTEVPEEKKREAKVGLFGQIKSIFTGEVEIASQDVDQLLEMLELDLLEADVGLEVAVEIKNELEHALVGKKIKRDELNSFIKNVIRTALINIAQNDKAFDLLDRMKQSDKPVKIMFIGPNGSGKTTTISKVAKMLLTHNYKVVFGAADTFRAAAVEQIDVHAGRLGIKTVKREYGSDPTAVAYDAVNYARAHTIDAVLIDTAGRQDTNLNLINELKKMNRVIQPNLKIYVGESIAGNAIVEQVTRFHKEIGIDGIILTKLDCDPKGGTILSLSKLTGIPIIYIGTGQTYDDIERFSAEKMVDSILS